MVDGLRAQYGTRVKFVSVDVHSGTSLTRDLMQRYSIWLWPSHVFVGAGGTKKLEGLQSASTLKSWILWTLKSKPSVSMTVPSVVAYGAKAKVTGTLRNSRGTPLVGKLLKLQSSTNAKTWTVVAAVTTNASGAYTAYSAALTTARYLRAYFGGDATYVPASSVAKLVKPKVRLTRLSSWTTLYANKTYYATGYIEPAHAAGDANKVLVSASKKGSDGLYHYVRSFTANYVYYSSSKTKYSAKILLTVKGEWKLIAYHAADARNAATYGGAMYATVK